MQSKTTTLATVKRDLRLQEWSAQIEAQQASGLTIREWCAENGIKPNTYYNRLPGQIISSKAMHKTPIISNSYFKSRRALCTI